MSIVKTKKVLIIGAILIALSPIIIPLTNRITETIFEFGKEVGNNSRQLIEDKKC